MKIGRAVNKIIADAFGLFWLPCPVCKENFGGHEWRAPYYSINTKDGKGVGVCGKKSCIYEAGRLTGINGVTE